MAVGERATVNQVFQIAPETTAGTLVPATKSFPDMTWQPGIKFNSKTARGEGRKFLQKVIPGKQWTEWKGSGPLSYNNLIYWLSSSCGKVSAVTHSGGSTSKDWVYTDLLTGAVDAQTYSLEKGDSSRASNYVYGLVESLGWKWNKDEVTMTVGMFSRRINDGTTLTASGSVTAIAANNVQPDQINVYMDTAFGSIGSTQLLKVEEGEFSAAGLFIPAWYVNRSIASFSSHVDQANPTTLKLTLAADSVGMSPLSGAQIGSTFYFQFDALGSIIESAINYEIKRNMAGQCVAITGTVDDNGVYSITWTFQAVEDTGLGYAVKTTVTNLATAL